MLRLLAFLSVIGLGGWFGISLLEQKMLYPFDSTAVSPAKAGVPRAREHRFETDGETLVLWTARPKADKPVIVYFHGNAGNLALRAGRFNRLLDRGYGLAALAYRGSSGSTGTPSETAIVGDARALWRNLGKYLPGAAPRVLYGESLGTSVAIVGIMSSAVQDAQKGTPVAALILEAPFTSVLDVATSLDPRLAELEPMMTSKWDSLSSAPMINVPLLVVHGTQDDLIPIAQGHKIFNAAQTADKTFLEVKGAGHTDLWRSDVLPKIWRFIDRRT